VLKSRDVGIGSAFSFCPYHIYIFNGHLITECLNQLKFFPSLSRPDVELEVKTDQGGFHIEVVSSWK